jgi:hypothetical protein
MPGASRRADPNGVNPVSPRSISDLDHFAQRPHRRVEKCQASDSNPGFEFKGACASGATFLDRDAGEAI